MQHLDLPLSGAGAGPGWSEHPWRYPQLSYCLDELRKIPVLQQMIQTQRQFVQLSKEVAANLWVSHPDWSVRLQECELFLRTYEEVLQEELERYREETAEMYNNRPRDLMREVAVEFSTATN